VWKVVYASYKLDYPKLDFQEETLKKKVENLDLRMKR